MIVLDTHIWVNWMLGGDAALTPAVVFAMQNENRLAVSGMPLNNFQDAIVPPLKKGGRGDLRRAKYKNPPQSPFFKGGGGSVACHPENCS